MYRSIGVAHTVKSCPSIRVKVKALHCVDQRGHLGGRNLKMFKKLGTACVMFAQSKQLIGCEQAATNKQQTRASNQQPTKKQETRNNKQQPPNNKQQQEQQPATKNLLVLSFPAAALAKSLLECMKCPLMLSIAVDRSPQLSMGDGCRWDLETRLHFWG